MRCNEICRFVNLENWYNELQEACDRFKNNHGMFPNMIAMNDDTFLVFLELARAEGHELFRGEFKKTFIQMFPELPTGEVPQIRKLVSKDKKINVVLIAAEEYENLQFDIIFLDGGWESRS